MSFSFPRIQTIQQLREAQQAVAAWAPAHGAGPAGEPLRCTVVAMQTPGASMADANVNLGAGLVQAALERMGHGVLSVRTTGLARQDAPVLQMLASSCELMLVVGNHEAQAMPGGGLRRPPLLEVRGRPCMVLPIHPLSALGSFVAFAVPLVRRMQGRMPQLPAIRCAIDDAGAGWPAVGGELTCVRASDDGDAPRVRAWVAAGGQAAPKLADLSGIGWKADDLAADHPRAVAYLPFAQWLQ